jgi:MoaA/NifB/PqqE/SkfB family radical SAM enzyme
MKRGERLAGLTRAPLLLGRLLWGGRYDFVYDRMALSLRGMPWPKRWNLILAGGNLLARRSRPWSMPLHMQFELTSYCGLSCPVCPVGQGEMTRPAAAMDPGLLTRALDETAPFLLTASLWGWGEPLLHPEPEAILRAARRPGLVTFLSTNGQNLADPRVTEALLRHPPTYLIVAVDGLTDEVHARFRTGARLAPLLEGVRILAGEKRRRGVRFPILHMRYLAMSHNRHEREDVEGFAARHGFDMLSIRSLVIIPADTDHGVHREFVPEEEDLRAYGYRDGERLSRRDHVCMQPFWFPTLLADGTLVACDQDFNAARPLGRLGEGTSLSDIWRGAGAAAVRREIRDRPRLQSFCRNCPFCDRPATDTSLWAGSLTADGAGPLVVEGGGG